MRDVNNVKILSKQTSRCENGGGGGVKIGVVTLLTAFVLFGLTFSSCKGCKKDNPEPEDKTIATDIEPAPSPAPYSAPVPDNPPHPTPNNTLDQAEKIKMEKIKTLIKDKVIVSLRSIYPCVCVLFGYTSPMPLGKAKRGDGVENAYKWSVDTIEMISSFFDKVVVGGRPTGSKYYPLARKHFNQRMSDFAGIDIKNNDLGSLKANLDAIITIYGNRDINFIKTCGGGLDVNLDKGFNELVQYQAEWDEIK
jgi:hypothetical protein